jgi:hypothetical protein
VQTNISTNWRQNGEGDPIGLDEARLHHRGSAKSDDFAPVGRRFSERCLSKWEEPLTSRTGTAQSI